MGRGRSRLRNLSLWPGPRPSPPRQHPLRELELLGISPGSGNPSPRRLSRSEPAFAKWWVQEAERGNHRLVSGLTTGNTKASDLRYLSATADRGVNRRRATARSLCQARASSAESSALSIASARSRPVQTLSSSQKPPSQSRRELRAVERNRNKDRRLDAPRHGFHDHPECNVRRRIARLPRLACRAGQPQAILRPPPAIPVQRKSGQPFRITPSQLMREVN